jgi:hypothetical protein
MTTFIAIQTPDSQLAFVLDGIASVFRVDLPRTPSSSPGLCYNASLDATSKAWLHLCALFGVVLVTIGLMLVVFLYECAQSRRQAASSDVATELLEVRDGHVPLLGDTPRQTQLPPAAFGVRAVEVLANAVFSMYSTLVSTTAMLTHCVSLPGMAGTYVFIQASIPCSAGHSSYIVLMLMLSGVLLLLTGWASRTGESSSGLARSSPSRRRPSVLSDASGLRHRMSVMASVNQRQRPPAVLSSVLMFELACRKHFAHRTA